MKQMIGVFLCVMITIGTAGCGALNDAYESNMRMRSDQALYKETNRAKAAEAISGAIKVIIGSVETEAVKQNEANQKSRFTDRVNGSGSSDFAVAVLGDVMLAMVEGQSKAEIARARAQAIQYLEPILAQIYKDEYEKIGTPLSAGDVVAKFMDNIPFLATVAGMYGLGKAGIENAGNHISSYASDNSAASTTATETASRRVDGMINDGNYDTDNNKSTNTNQAQ